MIKHDKKLEGKILAKAVRRFKHVNLEKIERTEDHTDFFESDTYIMRVDGFRLRLFHHKKLHEDYESCTLDFLNRDGYIPESFGSSNSNYAPILYEMFWNIQKRYSEYEEKEKAKNVDRNERKLRALKRIL